MNKALASLALIGPMAPTSQAAMAGIYRAKRRGAAPGMTFVI